MLCLNKGCIVRFKETNYRERRLHQYFFHELHKSKLIMCLPFQSMHCKLNIYICSVFGIGWWLERRGLP
jgi:hypothetical protein